MKIPTLTCKYVEFMPEQLEDGVLYVSREYQIAKHNCCCGCKFPVVTPLTPTDWTLTGDERHPTLDPSIGNWSAPCRSHYWVEDGNVIRAAKWSDEKIRKGRLADLRKKEKFYAAAPARPSLWKRIKRTWFGK